MTSRFCPYLAWLRAFRRALLAASAVVLALGVPAAAAYPDKPIRLVWPFAPGGTGEAIGRVLANDLTARLGQPVIVDSKPGAAGIVGFQIVKQAPPDGYTLLLGTITPLALAPALRKDLPYDPLKDFVPIAMTVTSPYVLLVDANTGPRTLAELAEIAKTQPNRLNYASTGNATPSHLLAGLFNLLNGSTMVHVPYKGNAPALTGIIGGETQMLFSSTDGLTHVTSGRLRALAVTGKRRLAAAPGIPTAAEAGMPDLVLDSWYGLMAPAGTPREIVERLQRETAAALASRTVRDQLTALSVDVVPDTTSAYFAEQIRAEQARWKPVVEAAGIKAE